MREFIEKFKIPIAAAVAVIIIVGILFGRLSKKSDRTTDIAYVETVENLTGQNASLGIVNRFSGVVEPQGLWTVQKNGDVDVKEIYVSEGDSVEEGDVLFEYDTQKYEEDLQQAEIDLERLQNDYESTQEAIAQLEKEKRDASSSEQANYTIQIKEQNLGLKDKEIDIEIKKSEIEKLEDNIDNAEVKSGIDGIVKSINESGSDNGGSGNSDAFITIMKVGTYRIKGTINEQNIGDLAVDSAVLVHSRVNNKVWKGKVTKIDVENAISSENNAFTSSGGENKSSKYPFYVELENSEGLIMGQHVYVELDLGQEDGDNSGGIWIGSYMVDRTDPDHPFVWKDKGGKLAKQEVTIGEEREDIGKVCITSGLALTDSICFPDESLREGMKTAPMSEKPDEDAEETGEAGEVEEEQGIGEFDPSESSMEPEPVEGNMDDFIMEETGGEETVMEEDLAEEQ